MNSPVVEPDGKGNTPTLEGEVHPVFTQKNWPGITDERYNALRKSMLFAMKFIGVSRAPPATFIPHFQTNTKRRMKSCKVPFDDVEPTKSRMLRIKQAQEIFRKAASIVKWYEDDKMLKRGGMLVINAPPQIGPPFRTPQIGDWDDAVDEEEYGEFDPDENGIVRTVNIGYCVDDGGFYLEIETLHGRSSLRHFRGGSQHDA